MGDSIMNVKSHVSKHAVKTLQKIVLTYYSPETTMISRNSTLISTQSNDPDNCNSNLPL